MQLLSALASILGIEVNELIGRLRKNAVAWSVIGLFGVIALAFLLVAAHTALAGWIGPIWAPLVIAGVALAVALVIVIVIRIMESIAAREEAQRRRAAETTALATTAAITALPMLLKSPLVRNVGLPLGAALAALYFLSRAEGRGGRDDEGHGAP